MNDPLAKFSMCSLWTSLIVLMLTTGASCLPWLQWLMRLFWRALEALDYLLRQTRLCMSTWSAARAEDVISRKAPFQDALQDAGAPRLLMSITRPGMALSCSRRCGTSEAERIVSNR